MSEFLQIGDMGFNVDQIQFVNIKDGQPVKIWFLGHPETEGPTELAGSDAEAFRYWWEHKAPVYVASTAERNPLDLDAPERSQAGHRARLFKGEGFGPDWGSSE